MAAFPTGKIVLKSLRWNSAPVSVAPGGPRIGKEIRPQGSGSSFSEPCISILSATFGIHMIKSILS